MKNLVYFIPYAMAGKEIYNNLIKETKNYLLDEFELIPIELRGHGTRNREKLYNDIDEAAIDVISQIKLKYSENDKVYLYGHCMGGVISYHIYQKIKKSNDINIEKVILGSVGGNVNNIQNFEGFLTEYVKGNMDKVIKVKNKKLLDEVLEFYKPILKQEYDLVVNYYLNEKFVLDEKIVLINGKDDLSYDKLSTVNNTINYNVSKHYMVSGDHFFINGDCKEVAEAIGYELKQNGK